jgi:hypothetical protein
VRIGHLPSERRARNDHQAAPPTRPLPVVPTRAVVAFPRDAAKEAQTGPPCSADQPSTGRW